MDVDGTIEDQLAIVRVRGYLDTKSSSDFERKILELLQGGARAFAVDFTKLDMITSAGIRILMMVAKRLGADHVALWGLNEQVKVVFQIAGLAGVFRVFDAEQPAIEQLKKPAPAADADGVPASKMTRLVARLLGDANHTPGRRPTGSVSKMAREVSDLLKNPKS